MSMISYESYELDITEQYTCFSFQSTGSRGTFDKVISFSSEGEGMFNLSLVDYNEDTGEEDDLSTTDNGDVLKIMATLVKAILLFLEEHPDKIVCFTGSTEERTRLYQIHINRIYPSLQAKLTVLGQRGRDWHEVKRNISFEAFVVAKKELNLVW